ncbi:unnamed protein product [Vitrella brassicaformis CCMP3155]|uniref:Uncharacterized protein n=2 Tax=Vitrella brassicaformis TaxID=1169539 RepID=A0A0G4F5P9_VITBC|nr:unnamed protein product [Vitrella brassicaformis CCMP3155]|eukprot:CEM07816.1 unnamed protein product [Vitrella brassicaformis CCMP3155]
MVEIYKGGKKFSALLEHNADLPDDMATLVELKREIETAIYHLERSNRELDAADPNGRDADFQEAITENIGALRTKRELLEKVKDKIAELEAHCCDKTPHIVPPASLMAAPPPASASSARRQPEVLPDPQTDDIQSMQVYAETMAARQQQQQEAVRDERMVGDETVEQEQREGEDDGLSL